MGFKQEAIRGVRWTSFSTLVLAVTQLISTAILARLLAKSDFGLMAIIMVVKGFAELFMDFGITVAILHKQNISQNEYSSLYWVNMGIGFVVYVILWGITPFIATFYKETELLKLIPLMCLAVPLSSIGRQQKTMLQKELYFKDIALVDIISSVTSLGLAIYLACIDWGIYALVLSNLMRYTLANIIYFFIGIRKIPIKFHLCFREIVPFFRIGMYNTGGQIINYFSASFDVLIIGRLLGSDALGLYNLAKDLVLKPSAVITPIITRVVTPLFAKIQDEKDSLLIHFFSIQKIVANLNAYVYAGIAILSYPIVSMYYGSGYESCIPLVSILAVYYMLREYNQPMSMVCIAKGRTDIDMWWNLLVLCVSPAFIVFGSLYSVKVVALCLLGQNIVLLYPAWCVYAKRLLGISFFKYYKALFGTFKIFALPAVLTLFLLYSFPLTLISEFLIGGGVFSLLVIMFFWRFERESLQIVFKILKK